MYQRPFLAHHQPRRRPHQADHAERAEGVVPAMIDDDPVQRRHREDHAERRALRQDRGRQRALLVGKPFVDRMRRHRERRPLAGAEDDAADHQRGETDGADHRELGHRPDHRHRQQNPAGLDPVDDEADRDGRGREQEEKRGTQESELFRAEFQLVHDRRAGEADHDLVGEIDQHEQEQEKRDFPGAFRRRLHGHGSFPIGAAGLLVGLGRMLPVREAATQLDIFGRLIDRSAAGRRPATPCNAITIMSPPRLRP